MFICNHLSKFTWTKYASLSIMVTSSQFNNQKNFVKSSISAKFPHFPLARLIRGSLSQLKVGDANKKWISSPKTPREHLVQRRSALSILAYLPISMFNLWDEIRNLVMSLLSAKFSEFKYFSVTLDFCPRPDALKLNLHTSETFYTT